MMRKILILTAALIALVAVPALAAKSNEAIKRNNFGAELVKQGKLDEAIVEFQRAVELDPDYTAAHLNLGYVYERSGRIEESITEYRKTIALEPTNFSACNNLGVLYDKKGLYDEAISSFEQALRVDPANATVLRNLENAKKNKSIVDEREARITEAKKQAEARPKDPQAVYNLARVLASFGQYDEALQWLAKALQLGFDDFGFMKADPALASLRGDPRYVSLLKGR